MKSAALPYITLDSAILNSKLINALGERFGPTGPLLLITIMVIMADRCAADGIITITPGQIYKPAFTTEAEAKKILNWLAKNKRISFAELGEDDLGAWQIEYPEFRDRYKDVFERREQRAEASRENGRKGGHLGAPFGKLGAEHGIKGGRPRENNPPNNRGKNPTYTPPKPPLNPPLETDLRVNQEKDSKLSQDRKSLVFDLPTRESRARSRASGFEKKNQGKAILEAVKGRWPNAAWGADANADAVVVAACIGEHGLPAVQRVAAHWRERKALWASDGAVVFLFGGACFPHRLRECGENASPPEPG